VVSSEATQAVCTVDVYGLRPVQSGQLSRDVTKRVSLVATVLHQNYFQFDGNYYKPPTGIAMGSPLSATMVEVYLQYTEEIFIKNDFTCLYLRHVESFFYQRYVDDIL
jgi:hypothetical protein